MSEPLKKVELREKPNYHFVVVLACQKLKIEIKLVAKDSGRMF